MIVALEPLVNVLFTVVRYRMNSFLASVTLNFSKNSQVVDVTFHLMIWNSPGIDILTETIPRISNDVSHATVMPHVVGSFSFRSILQSKKVSRDVVFAPDVLSGCGVSSDCSYSFNIWHFSTSVSGSMGTYPSMSIKIRPKLFWSLVPAFLVNTSNSLARSGASLVDVR